MEKKLFTVDVFVKIPMVVAAESMEDAEDVALDHWQEGAKDVQPSLGQVKLIKGEYDLPEPWSVKCVPFPDDAEAQKSKRICDYLHPEGA